MQGPAAARAPRIVPKDHHAAKPPQTTGSNTAFQQPPISSNAVRSSTGGVPAGLGYGMAGVGHAGVQPMRMGTDRGRCDSSGPAPANTYQGIHGGSVGGGQAAHLQRSAKPRKRSMDVIEIDDDESEEDELHMQPPSRVRCKGACTGLSCMLGLFFIIIVTLWVQCCCW